MIKNRQSLYLNSANRLAGVDASNCFLEVKVLPNVAWTHVVVVEASIPKSYYLIQAGFNWFTLREMGEDIKVTLEPGNYSSTCFRACCAAMMTAASTHGWTYTINYPGPTEPNTGKYTFVVSGNSGMQPSIITTTNVYEQLGFEANSTNTFASNKLVSSNVIKMQSEDALYMHSDMVTDAGDDVLQEIYTGGVPDFGIFRYQCAESKLHMKRLVPGHSNRYSFSLTDENNRVMNLNGLNWNMTLAVLQIEQPVPDDF